MRRSVRLLVSSIAALFALIAAPAVPMVDITIDDTGYFAITRHFIQRWWSTMLQAGFAVWVSFGAAFLLGGAIALLIAYLLRPKPGYKRARSAIKRRIEYESFLNQKIELDGRAYTGCTFTNVTFVYNGGAMLFENNILNGINSARSDMREVDNFVIFLGAMKFIPIPMVTDKGVYEYQGSMVVDPRTSGQPQDIRLGEHQ
jgi:hypothetical protein